MSFLSSGSSTSGGPNGFYTHWIFFFFVWICRPSTYNLAFSQFQDLIEMVVNLQHSVEKQAKVQSDLEDYIDSLLSKVISKAPDILQKNAEMNARFGTTVK